MIYATFDAVGALPIVALGLMPTEHTDLVAPLKAKGHRLISQGYLEYSAAEGAYITWGNSQLNPGPAPDDAQLLNAYIRATISQGRKAS